MFVSQFVIVYLGVNSTDGSSKNGQRVKPGHITDPDHLAPLEKEMPCVSLGCNPVDFFLKSNILCKIHPTARAHPSNRDASGLGVRT